MPQWVLKCGNCTQSFRYSDVEPQLDNIFYDPLWPYRPAVSESGVEMACPHGKTSAVYHRYQLTLRRPAAEVRGLFQWQDSPFSKAISED
jgi:hypothetical protein